MHKGGAILQCIRVVHYGKRPFLPPRKKRDSETSLPVGSQVRNDRSNFLPAENESIEFLSRGK